MNIIKIIGADLLGFWIIGTISICIGLALNQFYDRPLPLVYQSKSMRLEIAVKRVVQENAVTYKNETALPHVLTLEQFQIFVKEKQGLVLDARPDIFYRQNHVPGALSLPREDFENSYARLHEKLESDKNQSIAVYCSSPSCDDGKLVQRALLKLGYTNVSVFRGGWAVWAATISSEKGGL